MTQTAVEFLEHIYLTTGIDRNVHFHQAKQCALIAVNEILNSVDDEHVSDIFNEYWQEVKQEMEEL